MGLCRRSNHAGSGRHLVCVSRLVSGQVVQGLVGRFAQGVQRRLGDALQGTISQNKDPNHMKFKAVLFSLMLASFATAGAQSFSSKFDSRNHVKAKGVWLTVRYPAGWSAKEGERPNIVKKFVGDYQGLFVTLMLQIKDAGGPVEGECRAMSTMDFAESMRDGTTNMRVYAVKKSSHENKPAFMYDMEVKIERAGLQSTLSHRGMSICYKDTVISAWCSPALINTAKQTISSGTADLNRTAPICHQFFNSLVLMDQY